MSLRNKTKRKIGTTGKLLAFSLACLIPKGVFADSLTMTTWYPAPYGVYTNLRSTQDAYFAYKSGNVAIGNTSPGSILDISGAFTVRGLLPPPVSPAGQGRIYFDSTLNKFQMSENGQPYKDLGGSGTGPWTENAAANSVYLTNTSRNVGIGTTNPTAALDVHGNVNTLPSDVTFTHPSLGGVRLPTFVSLRDMSSRPILGIERYDGGPLISFYYSETVIGTITNIGGNVQYNTTSDRRLKENISTTKSGLSKLMQIPVNDFNFISDPNKTMVQGFIAQELYKVYPEAVSAGGNDPNKNPWAVDYGRLTPLIIKSVQEQQGVIASQQKEIQNLKAEIKELRDMLSKKSDRMPPQQTKAP